jgi:CrcB protein
MEKIMDRSFLLVGIGGFAGSVLRYWLSLFVGQHVISAFPFGTFIVNVIGCFLIGLLVGLSDRGSLISPDARLFLATGFCGGFTTFSTFSHESMALLKDGELLFLAANVGLSVAAGFLATYLGTVLVRSI